MRSHGIRSHLGVAWRLAVAVLGVFFAARAWAGDVTFKVVATHPHDPAAFTQGLVLHGGHLYESTGLNGRSSLRRTDPRTGRVLDIRMLDPAHFGEGLALWSGRFYQLTWKSRQVLLYDAATLAPAGTLPLDGEGWGAAATPFGIVTSDGSDVLTWRDPATFKAVRKLPVTDGGRPVHRLNELEWLDGFVLANVWHEDRIALISPSTGKVAAWIDCSGLRARMAGLPPESDLNGTAWDPVARRLYVTGKLWPKTFELALEGLPGQ